MMNEIKGETDMFLPDDEEFTRFHLHYQQIMALYESAIQCVSMRLNIMEKEAGVSGKHNPIRSISSRIKQPLSINRKLRNRGMPLTTKSIMENLHDVAGVRIICEYLSDVYKVRDNLLADGFMELLLEKDYIKTPKPNGYRSLHLIIAVPIPFKTGVQKVICELQLRTTAMDTWAALEHSLRYKKDRPCGPEIDRELLECADMLSKTDVKMQRIAEQLRIFE